MVQPLDHPVHPEEIKARLRMRYGTVRRFEEEKGLQSGSVSRVINFETPWLVTAQAIAAELDIPLHRVSLHYYKKLIQRPVSRKRRATHRLNAEAK